MSMAENRYYELFTKKSETPEWMRNERYEYCEPYIKPAKRRSIGIHSLLAALMLIR